MADYDEAQRANELINQINSLRRENAELAAELEQCVRNVGILAGNVQVVSNSVGQTMGTLEQSVASASVEVEDVRRALKALTESYFVFKQLSTASKNLTQYTDEYHTRFAFYNELRRITLGYVIGLEASFASSETMRRKVEKCYLQNTDYWLAYAASAVMLWASNEREAAKRALNKSLSMDFYRASVFYLLVNLRFGRVEVAREWYLNYLDKVDYANVGEEWHYLLQAYLSGAFGQDDEFQELVQADFGRMMAQVQATTADFGARVAARARREAETMLHRTELSYAALSGVCAEYDTLLDMLSDAEKYALLAADYNELADLVIEADPDVPQRVENVLYDLINDYDVQELQVVKKIKYNEAIMEAEGNLKAAQRRYDLTWADAGVKKPLGDLLIRWAFQKTALTGGVMVRRFAISFLKEGILRGFEQFAAACRQKEPERVTICIDEWTGSCSEDDFESARPKLEAVYDKNRLKNAFKDKYVQIFSLMCLAALLLLVFMVFAFSPTVLVIAVLTGVAGGFLLWRRLVDVGRQLEEKKRKGVLRLRQALEELGQWRAAYRAVDANLADVRQAVDRF